MAAQGPEPDFRSARPMSMGKNRQLWLLGLALAVVSWTAACRPKNTDVARPTVIVVSIDTLRADRLPAYGYEAGETPHLDAFAARAILFENAISHCPLTLPSHSSIFTGQLPFVHGVRDNLGYRLDPAVTPTLAALLKEEGYATGAAVSSYVLRAETGLADGFDMFEDEIRRRADVTLDRLERRGEKTLAVAEAWLEAPKEAPLFFFLHLFEPHDPYEPPEPFRSRLSDPYDGEIATADALVGRFFDFLRRRGLYDEALIIVLSDHGEGLGDHGEAKHGLLLYRETLHVPLLVKLPGGERGGERVTAPAALVDVLPTVAEVVGFAVPENLAGTSLLSLGKAPVADRKIFSETYYGRLHYGWSELHSLTDDRFHFIESPHPELYDWRKDPSELENILTDERRTFRAFEEALARLPLGFEEPAAVGAEEAAKLTALGYLSAPARSGSGKRPDPKENLDVLEDIQRAVDLRAAGRLEETAEVLRNLQRDHPEVQDTYLLLAPVLRGLGAYEEALAVGFEGRRVLPTLAPLISLELARSHLALGQLDEAAAEAAAGTAANRAQSHELLARVAFAREDLDAARQEVEKAIEADPPPRQSALLLAAEIEMREGRFEVALGHLERARAQVLAGDASRPVTLESRRGDCLARLERYPEAEAAFRAELAAFPRHRKAYAQLAFLLAAQRRFEEIEPLLEELVRAAPDPKSYALAADTLERLGNAEAAQAWRRRG